MVESFRRQGFACLHGERRTEKMRLQKAGSGSAQKVTASSTVVLFL
jgi:hypothetical protein